MGTTWRYRFMGQEFGPVPTELLTELMCSGHLPADAEVREETDSSWTLASSVQEICADLHEEDLKCFLDSLLPPTVPAGVSLNASNSNGPNSNLAFWAWLPPLVRTTFGRDTGRAEPHWHFRVLGQEFGPVPFEDLITLARRGEIAAGDHVKSQNSRYWIQAEDVPDLVPALIEFQRLAIDEFVLGKETNSNRGTGDRQQPVQRTTAYQGATLEANEPVDGGKLTDGDVEKLMSSRECAPESMSDPAGQPVPRFVRSRRPFFANGEDDYPVQRTPETANPDQEILAIPARAQRTGTSPITSANGRTVRRISQHSWRSRFGAGRPPRRVIVAAGLFIAVVAAYVATNRRTDDDHRRWSEIYSVWSEFQQLRSSDSDALLNSDFLPRSRAEVASLVKELEHTSSAKEPAKQNMLWAARDYLLPMLEHSRKRDEIEETRFREQMQIARESLGLPGDQFFAQQ